MWSNIYYHQCVWMSECVRESLSTCKVFILQYFSCRQYKRCVVSHARPHTHPVDSIMMTVFLPHQEGREPPPPAPRPPPRPHPPSPTTTPSPSPPARLSPAPPGRWVACLLSPVSYLLTGCLCTHTHTHSY